MKFLASLAIIGLMAAPALAVISVDGTLDGDYGSAIKVQTVDTQFGDSTGGSSGGGELDAAYAKVWGGRLYVLLTGNQEGNFNKMDIFIDSKAGGENSLSSTPDYDFDSGGVNWISTNLSGLTFDTGFEADYHAFGRWGGGGSGYDFDFVDRAGGGSALVSGDGGTGSGGSIQSGTIAPGAGGNNTTTFITQNVDFAFDNSNSAGVGGGTGPADQVAAAAVTTGIEFSVDLADIGNPAIGTEIWISAMYNNGDHNFLSNQTLGGLPSGTGNLGGDGAGGFTGDLSGVDFNNFAGEQFFRVLVTAEVPEPATLALAGLAIVGMACGRRRLV